MLVIKSRDRKTITVSCRTNTEPSSNCRSRRGRAGTVRCLPCSGVSSRLWSDSPCNCTEWQLRVCEPRPKAAPECLPRATLWTLPRRFALLGGALVSLKSFVKMQKQLQWTLWDHLRDISHVSVKRAIYQEIFLPATKNLLELDCS